MSLKRSFAILLLISLLVGLLPSLQVRAAIVEAAVFVAPNGNDSNDGSVDAPFLTLERARDAIRELKAGTGLPEGGVTVYLRGGVYERTQSFLLDERDSGAADAKIVYKAYPGESVRLTGGMTLDKSWFDPVEDPAVLNRIISVEARGKVLQADLKSRGIEDYGQMSRHGYWLANDVSLVPPMELYVDGEGMTLARWPNESTVQMGDIVDPGPTRKDPDLQQRGGTFKYTYDRPQYWTQADDIWLDGIFGYSWEWSYNKIESIDVENKTITLRYGEMNGLFKNWYPDFHFAQNLLEEIDRPGEYYIDRAKGVLYFLPTASFEQADPEITVTMLKTPMINAVNASHITFEDLILENGRDSAVVIMGGDSVRIEYSEIRNFSNGGVLINTQSRWLYNDFAKATGVNHGVFYSDLHHIGGTAVTLNGGDRLTLEPGNNVVENSHIHDFAYYHKAYNPGVILTGAGNRLSRNEIYDAPHPGVLIFGNDHLVEYNNIYDVAKMFSDLGAIYMNQGHLPQERGTVIRRNYFHQIGEGKAGVEGIYPDNFTMGLTIEENIFYRMGNSAIRNNGGSYILTRNNIFVDAKVPYDYADLYLGDGPDQQINKNYMPQWIALFEKYNNFEGMPHLIKYPELADFFEENRYYPTTNTFQNNVVWNPTKARSGTTNANGAYDKYNLVQYAGNWVTNTDPGFADWANGDFNLTEGAEVFRRIPGFQTIPFDEIGIDGKAGPYLAPESIDVEDVQFYDDAVTVDMGKTRKLYTAVLPWNATNRTLTYESGDPSIATVDANGVVKGVMPGETTVTVASAADPTLVDEVAVVVEVGDGILEYTDFDSGRNGWPTDPNRSIVDVGGNKMYKLLKGATAINENVFTNYELTFKLKTPETIPAGVATFYIFDRQNTSGSSGRIGYRKLEDGTSRWLLYNGAWATVKETVFPYQDLLPNTEYDVRVIVKGPDISVYVDGVLKLKVTDPTFNASGKVGFYAGGFDYLMFDDVKFSLPTTNVAGLLLNQASATLGFGEQLQLAASFDPSDAEDRRLVWSSGDPGVATVDENGLVVAVGYGETDVTATSVANPNAKAVARVKVSDVLHATDFESGSNGWPTDPNRSIVDVNGDKMYRIANGASGHSPKTFSSYALSFKLRTPATIPSQATMYVFDRAVGPNAGRIGYRKLADGTSQWVLYDHAWKAVRVTSVPNEDLAPNTEYELKVLAKGGDIRLYVNGVLKLQGAYAPQNASGTIGFYAGGFSSLWFDDIQVRALTPPATSATVSPAAPNGENGWYTAPVEVALQASSSTSTVTGTVYRLDDGAAWRPYAGPIRIAEEGSYAVSYRSTDESGIEETAKRLAVRVDLSAPVTTASVTPSTPAGSNGWHTGPVELALTGTDTVSGVASTEYSVDGGTTWIPYAAPVSFEDGVHTVLYRSTDAAGNAEAARTLELFVDAGAPELTVIEPAARTYTDTETLLPQLSATDLTSGIDPSQTTVALDGSVVQAGEAVPLYALPLGAHTLRATVVDAAGNRAEVVVEFRTAATVDSLKALVRVFFESGRIDNAGIADSLLEKLEDGELRAFANEAQAQSGKHIAADAAAYLLRDAEFILQGAAE